MYEIFRLLLSYTMLSDMHTRSSNERVALSAPSGRPKGKQYLQKNIVMLNFTAVKVIIICLCHLVICDCWSCPCSSSSEIMSILNLCLCMQVVYIRTQSYISGCFSCAPVDDWLKIQQSKVREKERNTKQNQGRLKQLEHRCTWSVWSGSLRGCATAPLFHQTSCAPLEELFQCHQVC